MAAGLGDILGVTFVMMPRVFAGDTGPPEPEPETEEESGQGVTLISVPAIRRRRGVVDASGRGVQPVIGVGRLTRDAAVRAELWQTIDLYGCMVAEAAALAYAAIRTGVDAILARERGINAMMLCDVQGSASATRDGALTGELAAPQMLAGALHLDARIAGALAVRAGGEAALTPQENEDDLIILMAAEAIRRLRT